MEDANSLEDVDDDETIRQAIHDYFSAGFSYETIVSFLARFNMVQMSMSTLKRRLKTYGLKRKTVNVNEAHIENIIRSEIDGPGCVSGTDPGSENGVMAALQCSFRRNGQDCLAGIKAHKYGPSTERLGFDNQLQPISPTQVNEAEIKCDFEPVVSDYQDYFQYLFVEMMLTKPGTWREALVLFHNLRKMAE
eukprot:gene2037-2316_t